VKKGLLLGAGFSYDLGMPLAFELTELFLGLFNSATIRALGRELSRQEPFGKERPINTNAIHLGLNLILDYKNKNGTNYEELLADLQSLAGISTPSQSDRDSYHFLFVQFYQIIHRLLCLYQEVSYEIVYPRNVEWFGELRNLLSDEETWVFNLNHDLCFEYLALDLGIQISYGDVGELTFPVNNLDLKRVIRFGCIEQSQYKAESEGFIHGTSGVNMVKLHGSLSELEYQDKTILCNLKLDKGSSGELAADFAAFNEMGYFFNGERLPDGKDRWITDSAGELHVASKSMLTGGRKYGDTLKVQAGEEKVALFDKLLKELDELTIIGYGFGDRHINFRLSNAMSLNERLRLRIVDPRFQSIPECVRHFNYDGRVRQAFCGAAHWMSYSRSEKWDAQQMQALKENEQYRVEARRRVQSRIAEGLR
jgi:hypothetical protein